MFSCLCVVGQMVQSNAAVQMKALGLAHRCGGLLFIRCLKVLGLLPTKTFMTLGGFGSRDELLF